MFRVIMKEATASKNSGGRKPGQLLGQLVNYFFDDDTLAKSVPLQGSRSKDKNVLEPKIVHTLIGKI